MPAERERAPTLHRKITRATAAPSAALPLPARSPSLLSSPPGRPAPRPARRHDQLYFWAICLSTPRKDLLICWPVWDAWGVCVWGFKGGA